MKKIIFGLNVLLSTMLFTLNVSASSFNANIVGNDTFKDEITLYIRVDNLNDFSGSCEGLCGLVGNLDYDTNKIELVSIKALEDFDLTNGKNLVLYKSTGVGSGTKILSMKFKNKSLEKDETTKISFSNITASDGDKDIDASNSSKTIKFIVEETTTIKKSTTKKTSDKSKTEEKKSNSNYLSSIILSNGVISFDKETFSYDVSVDYEITSIEIKATAEDNKAEITGNGTHDLKIGNNVIEIKVKAEDKKERVYTLNIKREAEKDIIKNDSVDSEIVKDEQKNVFFPVLIISLVVVGGIVLYVLYNKKTK